MSKKEFGDLNKRELVDLVYTMMNADEEKSSELPPVEQVAAERVKLDNKAKFRRILKSTVSALLVVAATAVLISMLFLPVIQVSGDSMQPTLNSGDTISISIMVILTIVIITVPIILARLPAKNKSFYNQDS